jgi:hypothetical protein
MRRAGGLTALVALWIAAACLDITSNVPKIGSITPVILPSPSVVVNDVSRDTGGSPTPLHVTVFATNGDSLLPEDVIVRFYAVDSTGGLTVDSATGVAHGISLSPAAAVVATVRQANGVGAFVQTPTMSLPVVPIPVGATRGPDTTFLFTPSTDTLSSTLLSPPLTVTILASDTVVQKYVVSYRIAYMPPTKSGATGPTLKLRGSGADSTVAVTNAAGQASLQLRLRQSAIDANLFLGQTTDSAVVVVRVQYQGQPLQITQDDTFVIPIKLNPNP